MTNERSTVMVPLLILAGLLLGLGLLAYPSYRRAWQVRADIQRLEQRVAELGSDNMEIERLERDLTERREVAESELKRIPMTADVAGLIRHLSLPVDGRAVVDQTFTAGQVKAIETLPVESLRALPVTIDMIADFESIFATLKSIEGLDRLLRTVSVRMARDEKLGGRLTATIGIEAVFESSTVAEVR